MYPKYTSYNAGFYRSNNINNGDRFVGGGLVGPLLLGGIAGYAIGNNNNNYYRPNYPYYYPTPYYYPYPYYTNNYYYY